MDTQIDIISADKLSNKLDKDNSQNKIKLAAQSLLDAVNDWPTLNLSEPKELLRELINEIGIPLTFERIKKYSNNDAWKMEAKDSLLEIFNYDKTKTLENILTDITEYYK